MSDVERGKLRADGNEMHDKLVQMSLHLSRESPGATQSELLGRQREDSRRVQS